MNAMKSILIIDDDHTVRSSLELLLSNKGYAANSINHPSLALAAIEEVNPQIILLDMNFTIDTSGKQGLKLLRLIRQQHQHISVILMTGWATVQLAVEGMKIGARDFVAKPWDNKELLQAISNIYALHHADKKLYVDENIEQGMIIGNCPAINEVMSMVKRAAPTHANILITGESGTGKELVAEAIHQESNRHSEKFVKVNLGGIPTNLFESEMFGHKRGAFTGADTDRTGRFEIADKGTIFLDEIGEVELNNQVKLLRVLQEKTFEPLGSSKSVKTDVRVICATNRNLHSRTMEGQFREDLYYRINLINIHLPPLSERKEDIPLLIKYFIKNIAELYNTDQPLIELDTLMWLAKQRYKGNIRELKNIIERTYLINLNKKILTKKEFLPSFETNKIIVGNKNELNLEAIEIDAINRALAKYDHSISASAKALGITRSSLYRRIDKYAITYEPKI